MLREAFVGRGQQGHATVESESDARVMLRRYSRMYMLTLSMEMDRIETMIQKKYPEFRHIDLEVL